MIPLTDRERMLRTVSEKAWTSQVIDLARRTGWIAYHSETAVMRSGRWATPMQGLAGFPDVVAVRAPRVLFVELKTQIGKLSELQEKWLAELRACPGVEAYVWRPGDLDDVYRVLLRGPEVAVTT